MGESWITQNLKAVIADLTDECTGSGITLDAAEGYRWRIELMYRDLLAKECLNGELCDAEKRALEYLAKAYEELCQHIVCSCILRKVLVQHSRHKCISQVLLEDQHLEFQVIS